MCEVFCDSAHQYQGNPPTSTNYTRSRWLCVSMPGEPTNSLQWYAQSVTLRINTRGTHQLSTKIRGVGDSASQYQGNPPTLYKETRSRWLCESIPGEPTNCLQRYAESVTAHQYQGNPLTLCKDTRSRRLCASISGEPTNSLQRYAESGTLRIHEAFINCFFY